MPTKYLEVPYLMPCIILREKVVLLLNPGLAGLLPLASINCLSEGCSSTLSTPLDTPLIRKLGGFRTQNVLLNNDSVFWSLLYCRTTFKYTVLPLWMWKKLTRKTSIIIIQRKYVFICHAGNGWGMYKGIQVLLKRSGEQRKQP